MVYKNSGVFIPQLSHMEWNNMIPETPRPVALVGAPLPWSADPEGLVAVQIEDANGIVIAEAYGESTGAGGANAGLIARAVNCHADLVAALKAIVSHADADCGRTVRHEDIDAGRAAIAKASRA